MMVSRTTYCLCGSSIKLTCSNIKSLDGAMAIWWSEHQGDGHGPATRAQALAGRQRNEYRGPAPVEVGDDL
jgi:hypothetical protein